MITLSLSFTLFMNTAGNQVVTVIAEEAASYDIKFEFVDSFDVMLKKVRRETNSHIATYMHAYIHTNRR